MTNKPKIMIVGGGVAGASLAIRLARRDLHVTLIEREKFPRHKLCGEFVSPEALLHFKNLGVLDEMLAIGGDRISETVFYSAGGMSVGVPSGWFENGSLGALSISRAEMDLRLLEKAKESGVEVFEETSVSKLLLDSAEVRGAKLRNTRGGTFDMEADLVIDATGRSRVLARQIERTSNALRAKTKFVAFKAHLKNAQIDPGVCEIYFFRGGYGGLSWVENGVTNCCFIIKAEVVREFGSDPERVFREVFLKNTRAFKTMVEAETVFDWIAVSIDGFGGKSLTPAANLLTVGDAASFIDPFTGSGMLMALEGGEILADCIISTPSPFAELSQKYGSRYRKKFGKRLMLCKLMRNASFSPALAAGGIFVLGLNKTLRHFLTRHTRPVQTTP